MAKRRSVFAGVFKHRSPQASFENRFHPLLWRILLLPFQSTTDTRGVQATYIGVMLEWRTGLPLNDCWQSLWLVTSIVTSLIALFTWNTFGAQIYSYFFLLYSRTFASLCRRLLMDIALAFSLYDLWLILVILKYSYRDDGVLIFSYED